MKMNFYEGFPVFIQATVRPEMRSLSQFFEIKYTLKEKRKRSEMK